MRRHVVAHTAEERERRERPRVTSARNFILCGEEGGGRAGGGEKGRG